MTGWPKVELTLTDGSVVQAQAPMIVSASRSTDIPAFYADWFMERLKAGYVKWYNPFNGVPLYVSFDKARLFVFWSKNPQPMIEKLSGRDVSPCDVLDARRRIIIFNSRLMIMMRRRSSRAYRHWRNGLRHSSACPDGWDEIVSSGGSTR